MPNTNTIVTPNMGLTEPGIGTSFSPAWAMYLNADMGIVDVHDHTPGKGVQITPAGLNINADVPFLTNNATQLRSTRYTPISLGSITGADVGALVVSGADLYYVDTSGNQVRLTASGAPAGTPGSIANLAPPASASWVSATSTFVWQAGPGVAANMDAATLIVRYPGSYPTPAGNYIAIQAPASLASGFAMTLPASLPISSRFLSIDPTGQIGDNWVLDNVTLGFTGSTIRVVPGSITTTQISNTANITGSQLSGSAGILGSQLSAVANINGSQLSGSANIIGSQISAAAGILSTQLAASNSITGAQISNTANILGSQIVGNPAFAGHPTANGFYLVAGFDSSADLIIRGTVDSGGTILSGSGFSASRTGVGAFTITFSHTFADSPTILVTPLGGTATSGTVTSSSTTGCTLQFYSGAAVAESAFGILVIGKY